MPNSIRVKRLFIVGGDGLARELHNTLRLHPDFDRGFRFGGFLGHAGHGSKVDYRNFQSLYKGDVIDFHLEADDYCIIGSGHPSIRKKTFQDLKALGAKLYNLVSGDSQMGDSVELGEGNIFISTLLTVDIKIGDGNLFNDQVSLGHDCQIGDFNFFAPRSHALGGVTVGDENSIGTNSILLPKAKIGSHNKIGPMSVVYKGCKDHGYYFGNPAIKVGDADSMDT